MTKWHPDASALSRPVYLSLADQVQRAITQGQLAVGDQLPTHRQLADELGISVQTVSRAYEELIRRGLISGETGRGTFIRAAQTEVDPPYIPQRTDEVIDLSILKPVCEPLHVEAMRQALVELSASLPPAVVLSFRPNTLFARHRATAVSWLRHCGVETTAANVTLTNGATAGMTIALMAAAPPGSTVVTEEVGHHTLLPLASYLGIKLRGVAIDEEGIRPDALDAACRDGTAKALFVMPNPINATATHMGETRRAEIARLAQRHNLSIVENDPLGPLLSDRRPPLAALAPERTLYVTSFTKTVMPGLRTGYLVVPDRLLAAVTNRHLVTNWIATPIVAEIATRWVESGFAMEMVEWQRKALHRRHALAAEILQGIPHRSHPEGLHLWLPLGEGRPEATFVSHARHQGVALAPGSAFAIGPGTRPDALRVSIGSTTEAELHAGLRVIVNLLNSDPEPVLLAI
ncbi:GntR family transcriptional regulator [Azospirillum sp. TSH7]|uniref:MocR-like ectoine utilization transcription factor EhuR n=1 Tax=unclassified Azospirillum TaxID=2630922 RepID=UPI000D620813|nr:MULTISPECIES: PLP-dependent aminotransferase family protein [unclassified Azospirillum]PWC62966.1 GntR family transcriptional regulator [Azospirillum sp. TSH20]PWC63887.1 GntR family transcriptional regulator [Azospirillum sp. TSH7]